MLFQKKIKVAVHDGTFHVDDVFSVAILELFLKKPLKVFRTRDEKILSKMDYLLDVGRQYNPKENKFDHHQENWNEKRENGIIYATCGLVWKEFGERICNSKEVAKIIEDKVIQIIDAEDNGIDTYKKTESDLSPYCFSDFIFSMNPTYKEKNEDADSIFEKAVSIVKKMLEREIKRSMDYVSGLENMQKIYYATEDKRIIVLDDQYPAKRFFVEFPEPLFIIKPNFDTRKSWSVSTVNVKGEKFKARMDLPESWAGKSGEELQKITGVTDAIFCHNKRFMASVGSREGAIKLAELALSYKV